MYVRSGKLFYGRPYWAAKIRYLDFVYQKYNGNQPVDDMDDLVEECLEFLKDHPTDSVPI